MVPHAVGPPTVFGSIAGRVPCRGMDLTYPPEAEEFRRVISAWLAENLPAGWGSPEFVMTPEERATFNTEWTAKLFAGGWICASWPVDYGGKGLTLLQQVVLNEEFARVGAPLRGDFFGDTLVGPTILQWGSEEQKKQFIPSILSGEISWCQGFSEPDAGSDLASLKTKAVLDGDEWVINGQKVWTTQAQHADYIFLLARTDPDVPKHAGISYLLIPMRQPGIEVRPIQQIDGSAEFNEVFLTNARCPKDNVIGGVNNGWKVAMTTLGFERGTSATTSYRRFRKEFNEILQLAQASGAAADPLIRQRLALAWSKIKIMEINGYRTLTDAVRGTHTTAALSACNKMFWSETHQETLLLGMDILGMHGPDAARRGGTGHPSSRGAPGLGQVSGQQPAVALLLLPLRDDLGRSGGDPTQHRGRACARPAERTAALALGSSAGDKRGLVQHRDPPSHPVDLRHDVLQQGVQSGGGKRVMVAVRAGEVHPLPARVDNPVLERLHRNRAEGARLTERRSHRFVQRCRPFPQEHRRACQLRSVADVGGVERGAYERVVMGLVPEQADAPAGAKHLYRLRRTPAGVHPVPGLTGCQQIEVPVGRVPLLDRAGFDHNAAAAGHVSHPRVRLQTEHLATAADQ